MRNGDPTKHPGPVNLPCSNLAEACTMPSAESCLLLGTFLRIPALSVIAPQKTSWNRMEFLMEDSQSRGGSFLYLEVREDRLTECGVAEG